MSPLIYFLNAQLNTALSTYGLECLSRIDSAIERGKEKINLPSNFPKEDLQLDRLYDLIETYYFNEKRIGIIIKEKKAQILNFDDPPDVSDDYEDNFNLWYAFLRKMISQVKKDSSEISSLEKGEDQKFYLRRPKGWKSIPFEMELYLADEISEAIQKKFSFELIRDPPGNWLLRKSK